MVRQLAVWARIRNEEVRRKVGEQVDLLERAEMCVLRWFGHVMRMNDKGIARRVYESGV